MRLKTILISILFSAFLVTPTATFADRGMIAWPPDVQLNQKAQNAVVAWNRSKEVIILSSNIESDSTTTALEIMPLPSEPRVKQGSFEIFEKMTNIIKEKLERARREGVGLKKGDQGVEVVFEKEIGAHEITVVKVNELSKFLEWIKEFTERKELETKELSSNLRSGILNYLKRDIRYFAFDVIKGNKKQSIEPLIYSFESDYLFYPMLVSGVSEISESRAEINLFLVTPPRAKIPDIPHSYYEHYWFSNYGYPVEFNQNELEEVSEEISKLFEDGAKVRKSSLFGKLNKINRDLMLLPYSWNEEFGLGSSGEKVKALQKVLINEGTWNSEVEATGYFGPITKEALSEFQEKYEEDILSPISLERGTGYFGNKTKSYLERISITGLKEKIKWERDLRIGVEGEDVKRLQGILIEEGVWQRPDVSPTGYFGPITKEAVVRLQEKHKKEILEPLGLSKGTGYVGPLTLQFLRGGSQKESRKDINYCETDQDCVLVKENCCPCSMGGTKKCINKSYEQEWISDLNCKEKTSEVMCPAVYKCPFPSGCECVDNKCQTVD